MGWDIWEGLTWGRNSWQKPVRWLWPTCTANCFLNHVGAISPSQSGHTEPHYCSFLDFILPEGEIHIADSGNRLRTHHILCPSEPPRGLCFLNPAISKSSRVKPYLFSSFSRYRRRRDTANHPEIPIPSQYLLRLILSYFPIKASSPLSVFAIASIRRRNFRYRRSRYISTTTQRAT